VNYNTAGILSQVYLYECITIIMSNEYVIRCSPHYCWGLSYPVY